MHNPIWLLEPGDKISFLKRTYELVGDGPDLQMIIRSHPRHIEKLCKLLKLEQRKPKSTPTPSNASAPQDEVELEPADASLFRSCAGILLYIANDCVECQHGIRALSQEMSKPTKGGLRKLKHLVSYLKGVRGYAAALDVPTKGSGITGQGYGLDLLELHTDADWSGDPKTRKSVSASVISFNGHVLATASRAQKTISLSSCESEFNAAVSGMVDMIFISNAIEFLLLKEIKRVAHIDSASAKSLISRQGVGRTRHLHGKLLWIQDLAKSEYMRISSINTMRNVADIGTKSLSKERILCLLYLLNVVDCSDSFARVGATEHADMASKLALRQEVRRLQQRVAPAVQPNVMVQALRIATILSELNVVNALSLSAYVSPIFDYVTQAFLLLIMVVCAMCMQGCEPFELQAHAALVELWFIRLVEGLMEQPVLGFSAIIVVVLVPWVIVLLMCCRTTHLKVTLMHETQTRVDAHDAGEVPQDVQDRLHAWMHEHIARPAAAAKAAAAAAAAAASSSSQGGSGGVNLQPENRTWVIAKPGAKPKPKRIRNRRPDDINRIGHAEAIQRGYEPCNRCCRT